VPHQANARITTALRERLALEPDQVADTIACHGNTGAASIPLALAQAAGDGRIPRTGRLLLTAFGAGFAYGRHAARGPGRNSDLNQTRGWRREFGRPAPLNNFVFGRVTSCHHSITGRRTIAIVSSEQLVAPQPSGLTPHRRTAREVVLGPPITGRPSPSDHDYKLRTLGKDVVVQAVEGDQQRVHRIYERLTRTQ
jgi:hypothetical protein